MPAVEVQGLVKEYGPVVAVDGIDFSVADGEVFSFLGPNGAGKTTTVEILEGLRRATRGKVRVLGRDPWNDGADLHREIGVIPQEFRFFEKITPREAILYYGALFDKSPDADDLLQKVALADKAEARFDTLSGGQKQKLGLALSLVSEPKICFLDEPTTGLDPQARRAIWEVIRSLRREGRTVFLTTHYLEEAELLSDHVAIINRGRIIAEGTPKEIIRAHGGPDRLRFEAPAQLATALGTRIDLPIRAESGYVDVELHGPQDALRILTAANTSGVPWGRFTVQQDTLEDVFVRLVGRMDDGVLKSEAPA